MESFSAVTCSRLMSPDSLASWYPATMESKRGVGRVSLRVRQPLPGVNKIVRGDLFPVRPLGAAQVEGQVTVPSTLVSDSALLAIPLVAVSVPSSLDEACIRFSYRCVRMVWSAGSVA